MSRQVKNLEDLELCTAHVNAGRATASVCKAFLFVLVYSNFPNFHYFNMWF
jgi:hypothetical protein